MSWVNGKVLRQLEIISSHLGQKRLKYRIACQKLGRHRFIENTSTVRGDGTEAPSAYPSFWTKSQALLSSYSVFFLSTIAWHLNSVCMRPLRCIQKRQSLLSFVKVNSFPALISGLVPPGFVVLCSLGLTDEWSYACFGELSQRVSKPPTGKSGLPSREQVNPQ